MKHPLLYRYDKIDIDLRTVPPSRRIFGNFGD
jgi:hypothetical protein